MNPLNLILASGSPRRHQFLQALALPHRIVTADIDETPLPSEDVPALVARLAVEKARTVAAQVSETARPALVIGADTMVAQDGALLGKPTSAADAAAMLRRLRSRPHQVHSAVAVVFVDREGEHRARVRVNRTDVTMRAYTDEEIARYVASGDPMDKAGAYAIQHRQFDPVQTLDGCPASVMGLPLADLRDLLAEFGIELTQPVEPICHRLTGLPCCQEMGRR